MPKLNEYYKKNGFPFRKIIVTDKIHEKILAPYLYYYPDQIMALEQLILALHEGLNISLRVPMDKDKQLIRMALKDPSKFKGVLGHFHVTDKKIDPGSLLMEHIINFFPKESPNND